jgi:hypothetical protein
VIAFGMSLTEGEAFRRYSEPGIRRAAEADSAVFAFASVSSLPRSLNIVLDAAAERDDLEALVLVHPHTELLDEHLCATVRAVLADPDVAVAGAAGATGVDHTIAWWEGKTSIAPGLHRYAEYAGGEFPAFSWAGAAGTGFGEVDAVDGSLFVLSPWAVRTIRFDEALRIGHGLDVDYCRQVRAAGRKAVTADIRARYHMDLKLVDEIGLWAEAHQQVAEKWDAAERDDAYWRARARRDEAEREGARAMSNGLQLPQDARIENLERRLRATSSTVSWRITEPLRRANARRRRWNDARQ